MTKKEFLKTDLGVNLKACIQEWDAAIGYRGRFEEGSEKQKHYKGKEEKCMAQWYVYRLVLRQTFGVRYEFTRTDEYLGIVEETDETNWLFKIERYKPLNER